MGPVSQALVLACLAPLASARGLQRSDAPGSTAREAQARASFARLPLAFVENVGQWKSPARFVARRGGLTAHLTPEAIVLQLRRTESAAFAGSDGDVAVRGVNLRLVFEGASETVRLSGREKSSTLYNFFLGNDPSRWRSEVRGYGKVSYDRLYEGVDLLVREEAFTLEYDLLLEPGTELSRVVVRVEGGSGPLRLDAEGTLVLDTALGEIRQPSPMAWEAERGGGRRALDCSYRILGADRFGFEAPGRGEGCGLVVDPQLLYSTFLGESGDETAYALALDATGEVVVAGTTSSSNFPTTPGAFDVTYNGPPGVCCAGDIFVTVLPLAGGPPSYSTFLGGSGTDEADAVALDATGAAVVAGLTTSSDFPTTPGALDTTLTGNVDAFVARLPFSGGPPSYSTFLGGSPNETAWAVALDATGAAVVAGFTNSANFPTTPGAFDTTYNGGSGDAFVARLPLSGGPSSYSTFLGGSGAEEARALALDAMGFAVAAGGTSSSDFPTTPGAFDTTSNGGYDAFVTRLPLSGGPLPYSTFLGGSGVEEAWAVALDATGAAVLAGTTSSSGFPTTTGAFDTTYNGGVSDAFVTRLPLLGGPPFYSTFLGGLGSFTETALALALDAAGAAVVVGRTSSSNFPTTTGAFDTTYNGNDDAFVAHETLLPTGASTYGGSSPGCAGPLPIGVTSIPQVGNASFAITCGSAPGGGAGLLGFSGAPLATPIPISGVQVWIDLASPLFFAVTVVAGPAGAAEVSVPIPAVPSLAGGLVYAQFAWAGPAAPPPCPPTGVSTSNALEIVVQP